MKLMKTHWLFFIVFFKHAMKWYVWTLLLPFLLWIHVCRTLGWVEPRCAINIRIRMTTSYVAVPLFNNTERILLLEINKTSLFSELHSFAVCGSEECSWYWTKIILKLIWLKSEYNRKNKTHMYERAKCWCKAIGLPFIWKRCLNYFFVGIKLKCLPCPRSHCPKS